MFTNLLNFFKKHVSFSQGPAYSHAEALSDLVNSNILNNPHLWEAIPTPGGRGIFDVEEKHVKLFRRDGTISVVSRGEHLVIRTGIGGDTEISDSQLKRKFFSSYMFIISHGWRAA